MGLLNVTLAMSFAKGQDIYLIDTRTHNLLVTWATHDAADVVEVIALLTIFRVT